MAMMIQLDLNKDGKIVAWAKTDDTSAWSFCGIKATTVSQALRELAARAAKKDAS